LIQQEIICIGPVEAKDAGIESGKATSNSNAETILMAIASIV
jgi:hypothetical protein